MKLTRKIMVVVMTILVVPSCSEPESAIDMATGRWSSKDGKSIAVVDLRKKMFGILQVTPFGPMPVLKAENLKIEQEQQNPKQVRIAFDYQGKHQTMILRILWIDDNHYRLAIVNTVTGAVQPLNLISASPTLDK